jgi:predicted nucleotidyltransferase
MIDLLERIGGFFAATDEPGISAAYLFGSAARGQMHRESDIDVAVLLDSSVHASRLDRSEARIRLSATLAAALKFDDIDLLVLNDLPPLFARAIVLRGTRVLEADPEANHAFVRDVQLKAADLEPFLRRMRALKVEALRGHRS